MNYKTFFKGKNVAVVGLGAHGEMLADIKFLIKAGALISLYDIRSETRQQGYLASLTVGGLAACSFGKISPDDLLKADLILLSPEISRKSLFLKKAHQAGIQIEYPEILFLKSAPPVTTIGVMGQCGKSTVAHMLYSILKPSFAEYEAQGLFFVDPELPNGALTHMKKIKAGDVVLMRITEEMMREYYKARLSPHVAIVTSPTSAALEGDAKAFSILEFQTHNNFIVAADAVMDTIKNNSNFALKAKMLRVRNDNKALVLQAAELFKVTPDEAKTVAETFIGLKGHQELVKKIDNIEFYNDAASATPLATLHALQKLSVDKNTVLIMGGAYTGYDYSELIKEIPKYATKVVLLPGSGSLGFRRDLETLEGVTLYQAPTLEDAVILAKGEAKKGDRVIFSPGCEAVGIHASRRERGEKFVKAVRAL